MKLRPDGSFLGRQIPRGMIVFALNHPPIFLMPRVAIAVPDSTPQPYRFELDRKKVTIGRSSANDIVVDCPSVSGIHCTMERVEGGYILRDQDSTNGMKLNGQKMAIVDLRNGIEVQVGDAAFEYSLSDEELDELDEEEFVPHAKKASDAGDPAEDEDEDTPKPALKRGRTAPGPPRPATPPVLPSASSGGGAFFGMITAICGFLAFYAGLDHSYTGKQEKEGRQGDISLLSDIRDGRPPLPAEDDDKR